jgi:hypothetical protein
MEPTIEEKSIKPVNKLRERFEALAASSAPQKPTSFLDSDHQEQLSTIAQETTTNASPRASGLFGLRPISTVASPTPSISLLKKGSESDTSNDVEELPTPTPTQVHASPPPSIGRKLGLKPPPPPPPERSATLRSKSSADSVGSVRKMTPVGVHRKPPPPPSIHSQPGHAASLSVGDLVNQINTADGTSFRSLNTS